MADPRTPHDSGTVATHLVLPSDTNGHGTAFGGTIMGWMDITASVAATRHCGTPCVTASLDDLSFERPIRMGDIVILKACVNYTGRTSMEVGVRVEREDPRTHAREHALTGYFTFVAVDAQGRPSEVPAVHPSTPEEVRRAEAAQRRHARRVQERRARLAAASAAR
jgi:acyl-CoA hydrolase